MTDMEIGLRIEVGDVYREAWDVFRAHLGSALGIIGVTFAATIASAAVLVGVGYALSDFEESMPVPMMVGSVTAVFVFAIAMLVCTSALYALYGDALRGRPTSMGSAFARGASKSLYIFATGIVLGLATFVGMIACCVPGMLLALGTAFWPAVVMEEDLGPIEAGQRAWSLTDGHKSDVFLVFLVLWFINMGIGLVGMVFATAGVAIAGTPDAGGDFGAVFTQLIGQLFQFVLSFGLMPFQAALFSVMYERRTRVPTSGADVAAVFA